MTPRPKRPSFSRKCANPDCQVDPGPNGPLPGSFDVHWVDPPHGGLVTTCSSKCRKALGLPERKRGAA